MFTEEERGIARKAAEMAEVWLPRLREEMEELKRRTEWHERNLSVWHSMIDPVSTLSTSVDSTEKQKRARRGDARAHIFMVLEDGMSHASMSDVQREVDARFGVLYPSSTIYRNIEVFRRKEVQSQEAA